MKLFRDSANNAIGVACISQPELPDLQKLGIPDLASRLEIMGKADDLRVRNGRCFLTFPVLVGAQRGDLHLTTARNLVSRMFVSGK